MNGERLSPVSAEQDISLFEIEGFDINAAFQMALSEVAASEELELTEKVQRMEMIVNEGNSDSYRNFVDFQTMAAQIEMFCSHDHMLNEAMQTSDFMNDFRGSQKHGEGDDHHDHKDDDNEDDDLKSTKKKKKRNWFT